MTKLLHIYCITFFVLVDEKYFLFHQQVLIECPSNRYTTFDIHNTFF